MGKGAIHAEGVECASTALRHANLRVAFLSSVVLVMLSTVGVALVAVSIGLRPVDGHVGFETALLVLFLTPEVYAPLRQVGAQFHANTEGMAAAEAMFNIIEHESKQTVVTGGCVPDVSTNDIVLDDVSFT